jgi:hypothetical protein
MLRQAISAKYPSRTKTVLADGERVTLHELTIGFELSVLDDPSLDNPYNVLLDAGLDAEYIVKLPRSVAIELQKTVIELTYPEVSGDVEENPKKKLSDACLKLLSNGHTYVYSYPISFFMAAYEYSFTAEANEIKNMAISARSAHIEDFEQFLSSLEPVDHEANLKRLKGEK